MPHTHSVSASIYVGAGARYETPEQAGLAHFLEHLCFKGTEAYPSPQEISQAIDGVGGSINAATDRELTVFYCKVAEPHAALALDVLGDLVRRPLLKATEFEKERKVVIEELAMVADSPNQQVDLLLDETLWPDQPLGRDVAGTEASVMGLNPDLAFDYLHQQYVPNNVVVSVAGAITHDKVLEQIERSLGEWQRGVPGGWFPAVNGQTAARAATKYKATEQAHISVAVRGLPLLHPDRYALSLLSVLLGEGMSSRLALELREERGLCYDVHSYASYYQDAGALTIYAGVDPADTEEALQAILVELARLRDKAVDEEELTRAKELMKGRLLLRMEDTRVVSDWIGAQDLISGRVRTVDEITSLIDEVVSDDLQHVAQQLFVSEQLNLAVVGPFRSPKRFMPLLHI
jgi:predicted Zn-dependent peptidase